MNKTIVISMIIGLTFFTNTDMIKNQVGSIEANNDKKQIIEVKFYDESNTNNEDPGDYEPKYEINKSDEKI